MEQSIGASGRTMKDMTLEDLEREWQEVKRNHKEHDEHKEDKEGKRVIIE